jgi:hypothetical protein
VGFLDRDYAAMMRGVLDGYKATAEQLENRSSAHAGSIRSDPASEGSDRRFALERSSPMLIVIQRR